MRKIIIATLVFAAVCFAKFAGFGYDHGTNVIVHKNETFEIEGNMGKNEKLRGNCKVYHKESNILVAVVKYGNYGEEIKTTCYERSKTELGYSERKTRIDLNTCLNHFVKYVGQVREMNKKETE